MAPTEGLLIKRKKVNEFTRKFNFDRTQSLAMEMMMMTKRRKKRKKTKKMEERKIRKKRKRVMTRNKNCQLKS